VQGECLGPYLIDRELGSGGMGKVYAAVVKGRCPAIEAGTCVALKVVHPHLLETDGFFKRFLREAMIGKAVRHENVVQTLDCDSLTAAGTRHDFLVMEYVEGQTLRELLAELERVPEELCRHIAREVAKGLAAIHAAGVVHRDMKPDNVLITGEHVVKIMDLGVACPTEEALRLSRTGAFVGSVHYAAPEQFTRAGDDPDGRTDLHGLGLVLYELATGVNPYMADSFAAVMHRAVHEEPRRLGDLNPQLSPFFEEVVHCLLAKKCEDRFADAETLLGVLEEGEDSVWWAERAYALQGETRRPLRRIRVPRETDVFGRDAELAQLRTAYEKAKTGEGRVLLIEGEAGIGKSRLVDELVRCLRSDGEDVNFLFGSYPPGGSATASGALSTAFREEFGAEGAAPYLPRTPLLATAFDAVLRGDVSPPGVDPLTRDSLATCFIQASRVLAAERTTVILIDDLHFAPPEARAFFAALALGVPDHRVLLIGALRPGADDTWRSNISRLEHADQMVVGRLGPKDLGRLLEAAFASQHLAAELGHRIAMKSDGNPFFAFEIIQGLREGQVITRGADGSWISTRVIDEIEIPSSVLDLVNARVAELTQEERDVVDVASCCGFEFDPLLIGEALGIPRIPLLKLLSLIERKHRLVRSAGQRFVFDHHQVQEALYRGLPELLRDEYHSALGTALELRTDAAGADVKDLDGALCVELCEHFLHGKIGAQAVRYLEPAFTSLQRGYSHAAAVALVDRALDVPSLLTGTARAKLLLRVCESLDLMGRRVRQEECAREAEQLADAADDDAVRGEAARALGIALLRTSQIDEAEAAQRRALAIALDQGDQYAEAMCAANLGSVFLAQGRFGEAREWFEQSLALCREVGNRAGEGGAMGNLGNVFISQGDLDQARECYERTLAISREIGHRQAEAVATGNLGLVLYSQGRIEETREHYERHLALSRESGDRQGEALATSNLGAVFYLMGRPAEARSHYERGLALTREIGDRGGEALVMSNLGLVLADLGDDAAARGLLVRGWEILVEASLFKAAQWNLPALVGVELRAGRVEEARICIAERLERARRADDRAGETLALVEATRLPGADVEAAERAFAEHADLIEVRAKMESGLRLYEATSSRAYLEEAKRLLDAAVANVSDDVREAMMENLRVNREIMAAWNAERDGGEAGDEPPGTESVTRVG